ncbi:antibiotic biosynthesis monooxygenase family protein [Curvivirga aplysinae]|uniref:antibiotic biosynthesis monooxygenase family protein n=1 Tax=Curvivirga aplysinae TaxID=2529852 RepID=UPI0012BD4061|nr:antibiotic biosynthesis monooxygenase [Curvivirga aplysinae]MTI09451.1 antibiotic biosynthesis monooxygenase [Curvivirga aplysinae]
MIAVIFEVYPKSEKKQEYLDIAAALKKELVRIDGFISVERFQSLTDPDKILSLSFFKNETAVKKWRGLKSHRAAQQSGRNGIFQDYRLRVASVIRDYGKEDRDEVPE